MNRDKQIELLYEMQQTYAILFSLVNKVQVINDNIKVPKNERVRVLN